MTTPAQRAAEKVCALIECAHFNDRPWYGTNTDIQAIITAEYEPVIKQAREAMEAAVWELEGNDSGKALDQLRAALEGLK